MYSVCGVLRCSFKAALIIAKYHIPGSIHTSPRSLFCIVSPDLGCCSLHVICVSCKYGSVAVINVFRLQSPSHEFECKVILLHTACGVLHNSSSATITKSSTHLNPAWLNICVCRVLIFIDTHMQVMITLHNKLWDLQVYLLQ